MKFSGKRWTHQDDKLLIKLWSQHDRKHIASVLSRSIPSISYRASFLGISSINEISRFWNKVNKHSNIFGENNKYPTECWLWIGSLNQDGYARFWFNGKIIMGHRYIYEITFGAIPTNLTIDHLCRMRHCINPDHLEAVTHKENILRGIGCTAIASRVTHCPHGHPYNQENTRINHKGARECKICYKVWRRRIRKYKGNIDNKDKTHCNRGHAFTKENTYIIPSTGGRQCVICKRLQRKKYEKT